MSQTPPGRGPGTSAEDYSMSYYEGHLGDVDYGWETESWRTFFRRVASRLQSIATPTTVLDVGCARGLLVQAFRELGVDARGFDVSGHAVGSAHDDVRDHLWVQSATDPIEGRYDLVTCIEVLEHMSPEEADRAVDRLCEAGDLILFSSGPGDFAESTHVNVRPTFEWVAAFAERGFYRRTDVSLDFLTGWAILLAREPMNARDVVARYESQYAALHEEVIGKRTALLDAHREIGRLHGLVNDPDAAVRLEQHKAEADQKVAESEGALRNAERELDARGDQVRALERLVASHESRLHASEIRIAELHARLTGSIAAGRRTKRRMRKQGKQLVRVRRRLVRQRMRARRAERQLAAVRASRTYRLAGALGKPARAWKGTGKRTQRAPRPPNDS